jgi:hypothetical protein
MQSVSDERVVFGFSVTVYSVSIDGIATDKGIYRTQKLLEAAKEIGLKTNSE